jgi:cyanophycinase
MTSVHLLGGGWDAAAAPHLYGPFLGAAGANPTVATVVLDEGDGAMYFARWAEALRGVAPCEPVPVLVPLGSRFDVAALGNADALIVCGGLTPAYADALVPVGGAIRSWLAEGGRPYAGFSAGAAIAAEQALVGGWQDGGVPVCPDDASEDLDEITVVPGLGLVPWTVDVHCAQWGTLPRLITAVSRHSVSGLAIDEGTAVHLDRDGARVAGLGTAWFVRAGDSGDVSVTPLRTGSRLPTG